MTDDAGSTFSSYPSPYVGVASAAILKPKQIAERSLITLFQIVGTLVFTAGLAVAYLAYFRPSPSNPLAGVLIVLGAAVIAAASVLLPRFLLFRKAGAEEAEGEDEADAGRAHADPVHAMLGEREANRQSLAKYQELTQRQARSSYRIAQISILIGLLILTAGASLAYFSDDLTAQLIVGSLAAIGSAISGYVGATSIRMYQRAQAQMNFYYAQPLVQSYIIQAEGLCQKLTEARRDASYERIIDRALEGASVAGHLITQGNDDAATATPRHRPAGRTRSPRATTVAAESPSPSPS